MANDALLDELLQKDLTHLPLTDLKAEFDQFYQREHVVEIAKHCGLTLKELDFVEACACGGGLPHRLFFCYLSRQGVSVKELKEACEQIEVTGLQEEALEKLSVGYLSGRFLTPFKFFFLPCFWLCVCRKIT